MMSLHDDSNDRSYFLAFSRAEIACHAGHNYIMLCWFKAYFVYFGYRRPASRNSK